tara:strand:- start:113 stop:301 length:189 start_codon:yes stop_codon:yes gene_type:complete
MKIKVTFSKTVEADSIEEAYDKITKDITSTEPKREKNIYMRCLTELTDMDGFTFEEQLDDNE